MKQDIQILHLSRLSRQRVKTGKVREHNKYNNFSQSYPSKSNHKSQQLSEALVAIIGEDINSATKRNKSCQFLYHENPDSDKKSGNTLATLFFNSLPISYLAKKLLRKNCNKTQQIRTNRSLKRTNSRTNGWILITVNSKP